jgi:acetyl-CoA C-acetyltransferase
MQAIASAVQQIQSGQAEIVVAGGTENMSQAPIYLRGSRFGGDAAHLVDSNSENGQQPKETFGEHLGMGITAENVAEKYQISREDQDAFALESQKRAEKANQNQLFRDEIVPIDVSHKKGSTLFNTDEHPRPETTYEKLSQLKPAFRKSGTVTAGNACGRNDGAAALVLMTESSRLGGCRCFP